MSEIELIAKIKEIIIEWKQHLDDCWATDILEDIDKLLNKYEKDNNITI